MPIDWRRDVDAAFTEARAARRHVLLDFNAAPLWGACARLDAEVYPDPRVVTFIEAQFVPVKVHTKEQPETFKRFGVQWTPVLVVFDADGKEQHRWEGYLPPEDFLGQLELAFAKEAFAAERWQDAADRFQKVADEHPDTEYGPLALYYAGVARYKGGDHEALADTAGALRTRHPTSSWAKKSSVWLPAEAGGAAPK